MKPSPIHPGEPPPPDAIFDLGDGAFCPAMWWPAFDEDSPLNPVEIAKAYGFEVEWTLNESSEDLECRSSLDQWEPDPPEGDGWRLVSKWWTENGDIVAGFIRKVSDDDA